MSDRNSPPLPSPSATDRRRASVTGPFQDFFIGRQSSVSAQGAAPPYPSPITTAAVNAQRRRLSLTTVGLSGSPSQGAVFNPRQRTESLSSANSGSVDESPFEDEPAGPPSSTSSNPATPFARRLSFGARAMRDVRQSNGNVGNPNGRPSIRKASSPPTAKGRGLSSSSSSSSSSFPPHPPNCNPHMSPPPSSLSSASSDFPRLLVEHFKRHPDHALGEHELTTMLSNTGEGYNFAENLRSRAERTSMSGVHPIHPQQQQQQQHPPPHQRAKSVTIMEPPAREMPKQPRVPDAMQERILKGDFYMD